MTDSELSTIDPNVLIICCEEAIKADYALFSAPIRSENVEEIAAQQGISEQSVDTAITILAHYGLLRKDREYKPYLIHLTFKGAESYIRDRYPNFNKIKSDVAQALIGKHISNDEAITETVGQPRWLIVSAFANLEKEGLLRMKDGQGNIQVRDISDMLRVRYGQK